jgi:hypothetical protein
MAASLDGNMTLFRVLLCCRIRAVSSAPIITANKQAALARVFGKPFPWRAVLTA